MSSQTDTLHPLVQRALEEVDGAMPLERRKPVEGGTIGDLKPR